MRVGESSSHRRGQVGSWAGWDAQAQASTRGTAAFRERRERTRNPVHGDPEAESDETLQQEEGTHSAGCHRASRMRRVKSPCFRFCKSWEGECWGLEPMQGARGGGEEEETAWVFLLGAHLCGRTASGWGRGWDLGKRDPWSWQGVKGGALSVWLANLLSSCVEHWSSCVSDSLKTSVKFRPRHTRGSRAQGFFCKKFPVQR